MIINKFPSPAIETAASRYNRDWLNVPDKDTNGGDDDRHDRTLLQQTVERKSRRYVDDGISAATGGAPIFDPNAPSENLPELVWSEDFLSGLDSNWTLEGTYDPPGGKPLRDDVFQISRPFKFNNFRIDFELDFPAEPVTGGHFLPQILLFSEKISKMFGLTISVDPETLVRTVLLYDGEDGENSTTFTGDMLSLIQTAEGLKVISGNQTLTSPVFTPIESDGKLVVILQTSMGGFIKNVTAYNLSEDNGEEPTGPEIPEGSFTDTFTEKF